MGRTGTSGRHGEVAAVSTPDQRNATAHGTHGKPATPDPGSLLTLLPAFPAPGTPCTGDELTPFSDLHPKRSPELLRALSREGRKQNQHPQGEISLRSKHERDRGCKHRTCADILRLFPWSSAVLEEGHGAKGREEGQGQVQQHQEQSREGPLRREIINTVLMATASAHAQHSEPPNCFLRPPLGKQDASLANIQLRRSLHLEQQLSGVRG